MRLSSLCLMYHRTYIVFKHIGSAELEGGRKVAKFQRFFGAKLAVRPQKDQAVADRAVHKMEEDGGICVVVEHEAHIAVNLKLNGGVRDAILAVRAEDFALL